MTWPSAFFLCFVAALFIGGYVVMEVQRIRALTRIAELEYERHSRALRGEGGVDG